VNEGTKILARSAAFAVALVVALAVQSGAWADSSSRQAAQLLLTSPEPAESSGWHFEVDYVNPAEPEGKPPAVRRVVTRLASGAGFDTSVPARCSASDAQLMAQGASACPADSKVGEGYIRLDTGLAGPNRFIEADVTFFNSATEVIFLSTERQSGTRVVTRSTINGGSTVSMAPPLPGAPPDGTVIDIARVELLAISREVDGELRSYVTTPPGCPASGEWAHSIEFTYADGVTQTVDSASSCSPATGGPCANRLVGSDAAESLVGTPASDEITGGGGRDVVRGRPGDDCLNGGRGGDTVRGGAGGDRLNGGAGNDRLRAVDGARDTIRCGRGRDRVKADAQDRVAPSCESDA
jgi:RTX calcium-binding nonapeptide repeat (4 copies)